MSYSVRILLTCLASYGHWCNSGTTVTEVTNHLLSDLKSTTQKGTPTCNVNLVRKPVAWELMAPRGQPATVALLNGQVLAFLPIDHCGSRPYPQKHPLQCTAVRDTYLCKMLNTVTECSALREHLKPPDPARTHKAQGSSRQRRCKDREWRGIL